MQLLLPYFIILIIVFQLYLRKNSKKDKFSEARYWERERKANNVRKQDIENLDYISVPDNLPDVTYGLTDTADTSNSSNNSCGQFTGTSDKFCAALSAYHEIMSLKGQRILNLTGLSNTDLKLKYGPANLALLSSYDENYTKLVRSLHTCGKYFMETGNTADGLKYLEFAIKCQTDISATYTILAEYYHNHNEYEKIALLADTASKLNSMSKDVIESKLKTYLNK